MKCPGRWHETRFVQTSRGLKASRNPEHVAYGSRSTVNIQARSLERELRNHARGRLLDMGCGLVPLYGVYRDLVQENVCIDWANTTHPCIHLDAEVDLGGRLPFEDCSFDTALLTDVLEHLANPGVAMAEAARILRPGGKLIISVPFLYCLHEIPHDYYRYTEFALQRMCQICNLRVVDINPYGGLPEVLLDLTAKFIEYLPCPLPRVLRPVHAFASLICTTRLGSHASEATKRVFPPGYLVVAQKPEPSAEPLV